MIFNNYTLEKELVNPYLNFMLFLFLKIRRVHFDFNLEASVGPHK